MYRPTGDTVTSRPAIVWVHGGSFSGGTKDSPEIVAEANAFAKKGYVNVSIEYRLRSGCSAANPLRASLRSWTRNTTRRPRFGSSAPTRRRMDIDAEPHRHRRYVGRRDHRVPSRVQLGRSGNERQPRVRRRTCARPSRSRARSSSATINPGEPPSLDFHGTNDPLVPYQWAMNTVERGQGGRRRPST